MKFAFASIAFVLLLSCYAQAGITNGTFDPPLAPAWDSSTDGSADIAVDSSYGSSTNVLHMSAATSYQWDNEDGGWFRLETIGTGNLSQFSVSVPADATALIFDASAFCTGASLVGSPYGQNPSALVTITYLQNGVPLPATCSVAIDASDSGHLTAYSIPIDADAGSLADISIDFTTKMDDDEPNPQGLDTTDVGLNAWVDNVSFYVPEPASMALLAIGLPLVMRRRQGPLEMTKLG